MPGPSTVWCSQHPAFLAACLFGTPVSTVPRNTVCSYYSPSFSHGTLISLLTGTVSIFPVAFLLTLDVHACSTTSFPLPQVFLDTSRVGPEVPLMSFYKNFVQMPASEDAGPGASGARGRVGQLQSVEWCAAAVGEAWGRKRQVPSFLAFLN